RPPPPRRAAALLSVQPRLPRLRPALGRGDGDPLPRPPGAGDVARRQRVRLPRARLLVRRLGAGLPGLAAAAPRVDRGAQPRLGHRLLVAALLGLGGGDPAPADPDLAQ